VSYRIGFFIEQILGHRTHGLNLRRFIQDAADVDAQWAWISWQSGTLADRLPLLRSNWTLRSGWQARRALSAMQREKALDAVFFHTQVPAVLSQDWMRQIPGIVSLDATPRQYDSLGSYYDHQGSAEWLENFKWRLNRDCFHTARALVTWSRWARDGLVAEYEVQPERVHVIPPGVDVQAWQSDRAREPEDVIRILFVGGDFERKGGRLLLEVFRSLRDTFPVNLELHLVTRAVLAPEKRVIVYNDLQPNSPELKDLFHSAHIFCLPTFGDCLPVVLAEAGAAGLPSVSTDVGGIAEIVQDGRTGYLILPGDGNALYTALAQLISDPQLRCRQSAAAYEWIRQNFDARRNAGRLLDLIKQIIDTERARRSQ